MGGEGRGRGHWTVSLLCFLATHCISCIPLHQSPPFLTGLYSSFRLPFPFLSLSTSLTLPLPPISIFHPPVPLSLSLSQFRDNEQRMGVSAPGQSSYTERARWRLRGWERYTSLPLESLVYPPPSLSFEGRKGDGQVAGI